MVCPFCLHKKTHVYNSRSTVRPSGVWRRRECVSCHQVFSTRETIDLSRVLHVKKDNQAVAFSYLKLLMSIVRAVDHIADNTDQKAYWLAQTVQQKLLEQAYETEQTVTLEQVLQTTATVLRDYDYPAYIKYASSHGLRIKRRSTTF